MSQFPLILTALIVGSQAIPHDYSNYDSIYDEEIHEPIVKIIYPNLYGEYAQDYSNNYYAYPQYAYNYGINDPYTGDIKSHEEVRDGDIVRGSYTVNEPDGTIRVVEYTVDDANGFRTVVKKIGHAIHPIPVINYDSIGPYNYH